ncbi:hypothetical protein MMC10_011402 [Thelotrema lepadinum]|nr:hypothetical protein [Thelotrema lepadinum]
MALRSRFWVPIASNEGVPYIQLREAAIQNNVALFEDVMKAKIDINALFPTESGEGTTALHVAARKGSVDVIRLLIKHGAQIDIREFSDTNQFDDDTPLYCAAKSAQNDAVQVFLEAGANPTLLGSGDNTPFAAVLDTRCSSARFGDKTSPTEQEIATVNAFIDHGLDINNRHNFNDATVTEQAVILADVRLIQTLFDRGASNEGLLEIAASHHDEDNILKFLVNQGAHDTDGKAIYQAARRGKPLLVSFLLQHVESKLVAESSGALHVAAEKGHLEVLRTLLDHGLSLNARNKEGLTPLIKACMPARVSCPAIQMLINQGALINAAAEHTNRMPCTIGDTPLHVSVNYCFPDLLSLLLSAGADINSRNDSGETPLIKLAIVISKLITTPQTSIARIQGLRTLIEAGSDIRAVSHANTTALQVLKASHRSDKDKYIIEAIEIFSAD